MAATLNPSTLAYDLLRRYVLEPDPRFRRDNIGKGGLDHVVWTDENENVVLDTLNFSADAEEIRDLWQREMRGNPGLVREMRERAPGLPDWALDHLHPSNDSSSSDGDEGGSESDGNEDDCFVCGKGDGVLYCCDTCAKSLHADCMGGEPPEGKGKWSCPFCVYANSTDPEEKAGAHRAVVSMRGLMDALAASRDDMEAEAMDGGGRPTKKARVEESGDESVEEGRRVLMEMEDLSGSDEERNNSDDEDDEDYVPTQGGAMALVVAGGGGSGGGGGGPSAVVAGSGGSGGSGGRRSSAASTAGRGDGAAPSAESGGGGVAPSVGTSSGMSADDVRMMGIWGNALAGLAEVPVADGLAAVSTLLGETLLAQSNKFTLAYRSEGGELVACDTSLRALKTAFFHANGHLGWQALTGTQLASGVTLHLLTAHTTEIRSRDGESIESIYLRQTASLPDGINSGYRNSNVFPLTLTRDRSLPHSGQRGSGEQMKAVVIQEANEARAMIAVIEVAHVATTTMAVRSDKVSAALKKVDGAIVKYSGKQGKKRAADPIEYHVSLLANNSVAQSFVDEHGFGVFQPDKLKFANRYIPSDVYSNTEWARHSPSMAELENANWQLKYVELCDHYVSTLQSLKDALVRDGNGTLQYLVPQGNRDIIGEETDRILQFLVGETAGEGDSEEEENAGNGDEGEENDGGDDEENVDEEEDGGEGDEEEEVDPALVASIYKDAHQAGMRAHYHW